ncbi:enoyl-CoA hydratase [Pusillimonas sp. T7-7]|uniref:enoyl-CoA hydratase n=1 Tax=Pusillimonas sp. (strain T7-7) TaxID=1007105 RepID=UPI00020853F5|nr:enoyl-CoA hydratase [Pusillimonas sp. T7-7]AEC19650.1 enoyl-CoA hydratase [Pusillimonas sp. T7-7]
MNTHAWSEYADLSVDSSGIGTLRIQNAGKLNILGTPVIQALSAALAHIADRDDIRVLVVRGEGDRAFIAGADIKEMVDFDMQRAEAFIDGLRKLSDAVRLLPKPVIARIPGWCLGGGMEFALACDFRVGADEAKMGMPEVKVGIPSIIQAALLPRLIGTARSNWMLLTGEIVEADKAHSWGLLDSVVPLADLDEEVTRIARLMTDLGPAALAQQKRLLREWENEPLETSILNGVREFAQAFNTGEPQKYMGEFVKAKQKSN